jgi:hypothetical protein
MNSKTGAQIEVNYDESYSFEGAANFFEKKKVFFNVGGATQKIRQTVKNSSQRKREFLRQIQEEENMTRNSETQGRNEKSPTSSFDDLEGQVS